MAQYLEYGREMMEASIKSYECYHKDRIKREMWCMTSRETSITIAICAWCFDTSYNSQIFRDTSLTPDPVEVKNEKRHS